MPWYCCSCSSSSGGRVAVEEQEFGAQQAAAFGAVRDRDLRFGERAEIGEHLDAVAVGGAAIGMRGRAFDLLALLARCASVCSAAASAV